MFWTCSPPGYLLFFQLKNFNYFYFWLHGVFVATHGLSLAVVSGGDSLVAVSGLVIEAVSLVAGHEKWAQASAVVAHELSCPLICGSFPDQGLNQCPLQWQVDSSPLDHQAGKSLHSLLNSSTPKQSTSSSNSLDHHDWNEGKYVRSRMSSPLSHTHTPHTYLSH